MSGFLQREDSYALPQRQRHLTALILRKLLASSSQAIAATLDTLRARLETLRDEKAQERSGVRRAAHRGRGDRGRPARRDPRGRRRRRPAEAPPRTIDRQKLREEIDILQRLATWARSIGIDTKTQTLLKALDIGFEQMATTGAARKALIFTESRRTQEYLKAFLESNGYQGQVVLFNGTNGGPEATAIYERWVEKNRDTGRASGSRAVDVRTALIEHFRDEATILLATEAAAEGINLQFCSLVVNYDLPWNPQRIEQRIGRCHRYGQKHDVVVINFLNERNEADRRVLELLTEKFSLFNGVFGASDEVLGSIESGVDFEKRILAIYQECRTPEEIDAAFRTLQAEMDEQIRTRLDDTRRTLFEHFDEDVHQRLRLQLADAKAQLDRVGQRFWSLTRFMLDERARFDDAALAFDLEQPPRDEIPNGPLPPDLEVASSGPDEDGGEERSHFLYRLSHPLGEHVVDGAKALPTPPAQIVFDVTHHPTRISRGRGTARQERLPHADAPHHRLLRAGGVPALLRLRRGRRLARPGDDGEAVRLRGPSRMAVATAHPGRGSSNAWTPKPSATPRPPSAARWSRTARTSTRRARSSRSGPTTWCCRPRRRSRTPRSRSRRCGGRRARR